ncbi:PLP-dependent aminotransferase family protein [bacterium]|nr:PLP-dependent aminotransferase family protein [bacterium]
MLMLRVERNSSVPIYRQVVDQVRELIEREVLELGSALPSSRVLADSLGLHRSTVVRAYEELYALGYIESQPGSYSRVRQRTRIIDEQSKVERGIIDWNSISSEGSQAMYELYYGQKPEAILPQGRDVINFAPLDVDRRLFPLDTFRKCLNEVLSEQGQNMIGYSDYAGYRSLRHYIATRMQQHMITTNADEILITNGSQHGLELIMKYLTRPADAIVVESPTYANIFPLLRYFQVRAIEVPMLRDGLDLEMLASVLRREKPALLYTMPNFQNPTGISTSQQHREALLSLCEQHHLPLVEDGFEEEMKYFGKVALPIKSMDRHNLVIYVGTFSKVFSPGIRVGWIQAERECIDRITAIKRFCDISSATLGQVALTEFCRRGYYDRHIRRVHRTYRHRMQVMLRSLRENIPAELAEWTEPIGGYLLWFVLKHCTVPDSEMLQTFLDYGVFVSPGRYYYQQKLSVPSFRLSLSTLDEESIIEGCRRLGQAIRHIST